MGGQRVEMMWPESGRKKWSEAEFDLGDLVQDSLPTLFTDLGDCDTRKGVMDILVLMLQVHTMRMMLAFCSESFQPFLWYEGLNLGPHTYIG